MHVLNSSFTFALQLAHHGEGHAYQSHKHVGVMLASSIWHVHLLHLHCNPRGRRQPCLCDLHITLQLQHQRPRPWRDV